MDFYDIIDYKTLFKNHMSFNHGRTKCADFRNVKELELFWNYLSEEGYSYRIHKRIDHGYRVIFWKEDNNE